MERIKILSDSVQKKIAAGEVVEGPYSIVKELVENSIDAGASTIDIQVFDGGLKKIVVRDDGRGIYRDDIRLAVMEHATSKIGDIHDIEAIGSYGFRGEALSSISSVSRLAILSRRGDEEVGARLTSADGGVEITDYAGPAGTTIIVENLFYNVPARKKFLKSIRTELRSIRDAVLKSAIPNPGITVTLAVDDARQITLGEAETLEQRIEQIYGSGIMNNLYREVLRDLKVSIDGFLSRPHYLASSRSMQMLFVNRRPVEYRYLGFILSKAYEAVVPRGRYPAGLIFIDIDPHLVDVNIHPAKREVKLFDHRYIDRLITGLAEKALNREHRVEGGLFVSGAAPQGRPAMGDEPNRTGGATGAPDDGAHGMAGSGLSSSTFVKDVADLYRDIKKSGDSRIIGIALGTYLILEKDASLYLIDFHAAHERIIYDSLMEKGHVFESQRLAFPRVLELSMEDHALILENNGKFSEIGFDIEDFSDTAVKISALPEVARNADAADLLMDFLESFRTEGRQADVAHTMAATLACHAAKRAGDRLTTDDLERLVSDIFRRDRLLRCPHGRPFVYKLEKQDLEKMFKRL
ncbi:MAG: hypothetical protein A2176_05825 [Spirochaetes bacterium RBG_13_51_14]|nr:MAG: hypothetical protein A2176_05825 [Spirochaetes bacterium RBG_13_51_14]